MIFLSQTLSKKLITRKSNEKISDLWPLREKLLPDTLRSKLKSPTFKHYTFMQHLPLMFQTIIQLLYLINATSIFFRAIMHVVYLPSLIHRHFRRIVQLVRWGNGNVARKHVLERLTMESLSKNSFLLYDFNGDYYLKFIALECYGNHLFCIYYLILL